MIHNNQQKEEWRPVNGYEGLYEVSNHGRVRSLDRKRWSGKNNSYSQHLGKLLSLSNRGRGYICVAFTKKQTG